MTEEINLEKREFIKTGVVKFALLGAGLLGLSGLVNAGLIQRVGGENYLVEPNTPQNIGVVTRDANNLITSVVVAGRTITVNRDVDDYVSGWEDTNYEMILTRDANKLVTDWSVNKK